MQANFTFYNPTKLYFGKTAIDGLDKELPKYGKTVLLVYGGGSIKQNGVYDAVVAKLKEHKKTIVEDSGVMPNPTIAKMQGGIALAKKHKADLVLAVGGGSVVDYAKALASLAYESGDLWQRFFVNSEPVTQKNIPLGVVLTMVGTGSEMNGGSVVSNAELTQKLAYMFNAERYPKFSILNPEFTFSCSQYQMTAGIFDIFSHILEQYFSGGNSTTDYLAEALLKSLIESALVAVKNHTDYSARANIMWTSTWALNTLLSRDKPGDWNVHQIAHGVAAVTDATHGMALAALSLPYYNWLMDANLGQFARFAKNVFYVDAKGNSDKQIADEGLMALKDFMQKLGLVLNLGKLGATIDNLPQMLAATHINNSGYKVPTLDDVKAILEKAM